MQRILPPVRLPRRLNLPRRALLVRHQTQTQRAYSDSPFGTGPAPPRLPKEEQDLFEQLQRRSTGAFSTPREPPKHKPNRSPESGGGGEAGVEVTGSADEARGRVNQSPDSAPRIRVNQSPDLSSTSSPVPGIRIENSEEQKHPNLRRGAPPEFEGEVNPRTGEVGGPKNEPLRWGKDGDWSYNGRVTDF